MRIDAIIVVACEMIAFVSWVVNYKTIKEKRYKLFTVYLGIIAVIELLNLLFNSTTEWSNELVLYINIPLQFFFLLYFLVYRPNSLSGIVSIVFMCIYFFFFVSERFHFFSLPVNFDSLSYGIGNLLLIVSIIIALIRIFKNDNPVVFNQTALFWVLMGLIIFYIGSFPYENFRDFFWSKPSYYKIAYFLHYLSQVFNCIMYLLFAYAVKWKTR